jgi:uncharacterized coiled-coil protein SlyX
MHSARAKSAVTNQEATIAQLKSTIAQQMEAVTGCHVQIFLPVSGWLPGK